MRIYLIGTVLSITEPTTIKLKDGTTFPKVTAIVRSIDEANENYLAIEVFGDEKIQRFTEAKISGVPQEMVLTVSSRKWELDNGKSGYSTYLNLKYLLGSMQ